MYHNNITVNVLDGSVLTSNGFDLLHPTAPTPSSVPLPKLQKMIATNIANRRSLVDELCTVCATRRHIVDAARELVRQLDIVAAVCTQIEQLAVQDHLDKLARDIKDHYADVFEPIPHVHRMLDSVRCKIMLKDASLVKYLPK